MNRRRLMRRKEGQSVDENTVLLLHGDSFADSSIYNHPITNHGSVAIVDGKFNKAFNFTGTAAKMVSTPANSKFAFGAGDYTIDFWIKKITPLTGSDQGVFVSGNNWNTGDGIFMSLKPNGSFEIYHNVDYTNNINAAIPANIWVHIAAVRHNGYLSLYFDGKSVGSIYAADNIKSLYPLHIGRENYSTTALPLKGLISELRVSNVARWTSNFTPPDKPY